MVIVLGVCFFVSCGGSNDDEPSTESYTYTKGLYVMTITKTVDKSITSMKSIYPSSGYELAKSVLAENEEAEYTLRYNGVVKSSGKVIMGGTKATFRPASGKPEFSGTFSGTTGLVISDSITFDDGTSGTLGAMKEEPSKDVAAFAEYWGVWEATIEGTRVTLTISDGSWNIWIGSHYNEGYYVQESATTVNAFQPGFGHIGHVVTKPNITMTITLYDHTDYPGTYNLSR
jgi:hypothetical protein